MKVFKTTSTFFLLFVLMFSMLFAQRAGARGAMNWELLGSRTASFRPDIDIIRVGAREGGFAKLKVNVRGGSLDMNRMVVTYVNGTKDEIPLRFNFRRGSESRVIDLRGGKRAIKNIKFVYDTKNRSRRRARIFVYGLQ